MPSRYADKLEELLLADMTIMPAEGEQKFLTALNIQATEKPDDWPPADKIRQKMSSLKSKLKKQQ